MENKEKPKCKNIVEECQTPCGELFDVGESQYIRIYCKECSGVKEEKPILNTTNNVLISNKEKPLSEKVHRGSDEIDLPPYIDKLDVEQAVERLKEDDEYELAVWLHNNYEKISGEKGWVTQKECRVAFDKLPEANQIVMRLIATRLILRNEHKVDKIFGEKLTK